MGVYSFHFVKLCQKNEKMPGLATKHSKGSSKVNKELTRSLPLCPFISSYANLCFRVLRGQQPRPLFAYFRSFQQQFYLKIVNFSKIQTRIVGR